jgi:hypothetical protein
MYPALPIVLLNETFHAGQRAFEMMGAYIVIFLTRSGIVTPNI